MGVDGNYNIEINTPMGKQEAKLALKTEGGALSGSTESSFGTQAFSGGTVKGDEVSWNMEISSPMGKMELTYTGKVSGDEISGEVKVGNFGTSPFKGKRV